MKLTEIFKHTDKIGEWSGSGVKFASFNIDGIEYVVTMSQSTEPTNPALANGYYHLSFGIDNPDAQEGEAEINIEKSGTGNEYKVFSAVISLTRKFLQSNPTLPLTMTAREPNRASLYAKMAKRLVPGWTVDQRVNQYGVTEFLMIPPK